MAFTGNKPVSVQETFFINHFPGAHMFGYLPPHGKTLAAGASKAFDGDIRSRMSGRELNALQRDIDSGRAGVYVYTRHLLAVPVATAPAIVAGAPVIWNTTNNNVEPASGTTWSTDLLTTQGAFVDIFLGVAVQGKTLGVANQTIQVDISPETVREFPCTSEVHEVDEFASMAKDTGNALLPNSLVKAVATASPFRIRRRDATAATKVLCCWRSAFWGYNAAASQ